MTQESEKDVLIRSQQAEIERLRAAVEQIRQYARDCWKDKKPPMAWRIACMTTETLKGSDLDTIRAFAESEEDSR